MKNFYFLFLLITFSVSAQIEVKIDSINSVDVSSKKRTFSINYHITNTTDKELSFFLIPNTLIANSASSLTLFPVYKIYQNGVFEDIDGPFYERVYKEQEEIENTDDVEQRKKLIEAITLKYTAEFKTIIENYKKNGGTSTDDAWIFKNQKLLQCIVVLKPNETKNYIIKTDWNKERYYKIDDNEFYLNENAKFEIELSLSLDKLNRKISLSPEEYSKFEKDKNFLHGTFTSNKMELNFKE
jgi:predicted lactoylglutathione lyase